MKFHIKDEDGKNYEVEEVEVEKTTDEDPVVEEVTTNTETFTAEEMAAIRKLIPVIDKLVAMTEEKTDADVDIDIDADDDDDTTIDACEEEVIDTCRDSVKSSIGSVEKQHKVDDSIDAGEEIAQAWAKRYGGNK